jgi:hypothetical protein
MASPRHDANRVIEEQLDTRLQAIETAATADVVSYLGPIAVPFDDRLKLALEDMQSRRDKLMVILETSGGYIEFAERMARVFRHHYPRVEFIVPSFAMSAGTVLVMSGDAFHMDYFSVLGPIDPQVQRPGSDQWVPALGYLIQYERLVDKSAKGELTTVEAMFLVQNFDAAELYQIEQERKLSIDLLKEWLVKYKFKDWTQTEATAMAVTPAMREQRAEEVANKLNDTERWRTHSRGIPIDVLRQELKLKVDDFGVDPTLGPAVREYYRLLKDYMMRRGHDVVIHRDGQYEGF